MRINDNIRKLDIIIRLTFIFIMVLNLIIQVLVAINLINLGNYCFQTVLIFIIQIIIFLILLLYYFIVLILNYIFKFNISKKNLLFCFFINLVLLLLTSILAGI